MRRFDWTIFLGVAIGIAAIIGGAWFDDLSVTFLWHPTAFLIVCGGTLGAVIVRRGIDGVTNAAGALWRLRLNGDDVDEHKTQMARLAWLSRTAQKNGVKEYENFADNTRDPLVAQGLILLADSAEKSRIEEVLHRQLAHENDGGLQNSATLEAAGGFAPTFGILGAVLGLISVLRVIDRPEELASGIATAFVATIYGLILANLVFLPLAARLRARHEQLMTQREELVTVILSLGAKESPRAIINQFNLPK
jgi:chemotaxis protein MotA